MGEGVNLFPWHPALVRVQGSCAIIHEFQFRNAELGIKKTERGGGRPKKEDGRWKTTAPGIPGPRESLHTQAPTLQPTYVMWVAA